MADLWPDSGLHIVKRTGFDFVVFVYPDKVLGVMHSPVSEKKVENVIVDLSMYAPKWGRHCSCEKWENRSTGDALRTMLGIVVSGDLFMQLVTGCDECCPQRSHGNNSKHRS